RDDPADRRRVGCRVAVAEDHVIDGGRVDPGPAEQPGEGAHAELGRGQRLEDPAVAADGGPDGLTDDDLTRPHHGFLLSSLAWRLGRAGRAAWPPATRLSLSPVP